MRGSAGQVFEHFGDSLTGRKVFGEVVVSLTVPFAFEHVISIPVRRTGAGHLPVGPIGRRAAETGVGAAGLRMAAKPMYFHHGKAERQLGYGPSRSDDAIGDAVRWFEREGYLD